MARDSVPDDAIDAILQLPEPPTVKLVEQKLRELRPAVPSHHSSVTNDTLMGQIPTRVGISSDQAHTSDEQTALHTIELLTEEDRAAINRLRTRVAHYRSTSVHLSQDDRSILQLLADDLSALLQSDG